MQYKTHNERNISADRTCFQDEVITTYDKLWSLFGRPLPGDGYKVDAEWVIEFSDGVVATVYNWKNGPNYLGPGPSVRFIDLWHIGGVDETAALRIKKLLGV